MSRLCIPCRSWDMPCAEQWCLLEDFLSAACHYKWCSAKQRATISLNAVCYCLWEEISYLEAGGELSKSTGLRKPARAYHSPCVLLCLWNPSIQALSSPFVQIISKIPFSTQNPNKQNKQAKTQTHTHKQPNKTNKQKNLRVLGLVLYCIASWTGYIPDSMEGL